MGGNMDKNKSKGKIDRKIENSTTSKEQVSAEEAKKEKKVSSAQKALPVLIVVCVSLGVILLATLIAFFQLKADDKQNSKTLESVYASSYYSMVDSINNLQVDCAKFETLSNIGSRRSCLKDMEQDCGAIISGLSILPIEAQSSMGAMKFFNQIDGICEAYIKKIDKNENLSNEEVGLITEISYILGVIKNQFNLHNQSVNKEGYRFIDASVFNSKGVNEFSTTLGSLKNGEIDYPTMIFDGPFSASLETVEIKGLKKEEISVEDAINYIQNNVFKDKKVDVKYVNETNGDFDTYNFNCKQEDVKYDVQITKLEGKLLTLNSFVEKREAILGKDDAIKLAEKFAESCEFENLKAVWVESKDNIAYINLAPIVKGVIQYPDLVKVKIDLGGQIVIGFESKNYCTNHITRNLKSTVSETDARNVIDNSFNITSTDLAIIPLEDNKEILTYELKCENVDGIYYFYVNANNKNIEKILKLVEQNGVNKLI